MTRLALTLRPRSAALSLAARPCDLRFEFAPVLRGDPGPPGPSGTEVLMLTAAGALSGHRVIAQDAAGNARYAEPDDASALAVIGISEHAVAAGEPLAVRQFGALVWPAAGLVAGAPLFLTAGGLVSHSPPASGYVRQVGVALDGNLVQVGIGPAFNQE